MHWPTIIVYGTCAPTTLIDTRLMHDCILPITNSTINMIIPLSRTISTALFLCLFLLLFQFLSFGKREGF